MLSECFRVALPYHDECHVASSNFEVEKLKMLSKSEKRAVSQAMVECHFKKNDVVITQGPLLRMPFHRIILSIKNSDYPLLDSIRVDPSGPEWRMG